MFGPPTIAWEDDQVVMIDQTKLPEKLVVHRCTTAEQMAEAIVSLRIRGAPAIGIAAAYGVVLGLQSFSGATFEEFREELDRIIALMRATRPTAVNLPWALERLRSVAMKLRDTPVREINKALLREAHNIHQEDAQLCRQIGENGQQLVQDGARVLTHCNAGRLATGGIGTALGILYVAHQCGKKITVYADETRPLLQGARLTTWELMQAGIPVTLICDNVAGRLMAQGKVDFALVGADRIAANGDVANKIGTYNLAVLCQKHSLPLYSAAPSSTLDLDLASGTDIPIEERAAEEVTEIYGRRIAPPGVPVYSPAFDVTPADLVSAIITEAGVFRPPYGQSLSSMRPRQSRGGCSEG
jgi:methylthioribose-1-phosphate isomerase